MRRNSLPIVSFVHTHLISTHCLTTLPLVLQGPPQTTLLHFLNLNCSDCSLCRSLPCSSHQFCSLLRPQPRPPGLHLALHPSESLISSPALDSSPPAPPRPALPSPCTPPVSSPPSFLPFPCRIFPSLASISLVHSLCLAPSQSSSFIFLLFN